MSPNDDRHPTGSRGHGWRLSGTFRHEGPGPFVTRAIGVLEDGRALVATSRRVRKGLAPQVMAPGEPFRHVATTAAAWKHLWLPARIGWWVAVLFVIGSLCFVGGGLAATWPGLLPEALSSALVLGWVFFVGSLFFTTAAYLQVVEAANADVAAPTTQSHHRSWFGWRPRNLGWLASVVQLAGTVMFNFSTGDAMISGLGWREADLIVWTPNIIGCVFFLIASGLAWVEYSHGIWSFAPRSVSWWIVVLNVVGSVAFFVSAMNACETSGSPDHTKMWLDGFFTFLGAVCFLAGSALLLPELSDDP